VAAKGEKTGRLEFVLFPHYFGRLLLCGFVLPRAREVTFFGSLVTNIVTFRVVRVGVGDWIRKGNQGVKGFWVFWHMSCVYIAMMKCDRTGQGPEVKRGVEVYRGEPFHCQAEGLAMKRSRLNGSTAQRLNGSTHNTQHTTHNTQHTTHNTQHTTHNTQHTTHNTQHTTHNTQLKVFSVIYR
jgi:hypothetical protein